MITYLAGMRSITLLLYRVTLLVTLLLPLSSCFSLLPKYNEQVAGQIEQVAKQVDRFYLNMLEHATPEERVYREYQWGYVDIEAELIALERKNRIRPLNKESARNCQLALNMWRDYKQQHKEKNTLSDAIIELNRTYMNDMFFTIQTGEEAKR